MWLSTEYFGAIIRYVALPRKISIQLPMHPYLPLYTIPFLINIYKLNDLARLSTIQLLARKEANVEFKTSLRIWPGSNELC